MNQINIKQKNEVSEVFDALIENPSRSSLYEYAQAFEEQCLNRIPLHSLDAAVSEVADGFNSSELQHQFICDYVESTTSQSLPLLDQARIVKEAINEAVQNANQYSGGIYVDGEGRIVALSSKSDSLVKLIMMPGGKDEFLASDEAYVEHFGSFVEAIDFYEHLLVGWELSTCVPAIRSFAHNIDSDESGHALMYFQLQSQLSLRYDRLDFSQF